MHFYTVMTWRSYKVERSTRRYNHLLRLRHRTPLILLLKLQLLYYALKLLLFLGKGHCWSTLATRSVAQKSTCGSLTMEYTFFFIHIFSSFLKKLGRNTYIKRAYQPQRPQIQKQTLQASCTGFHQTKKRICTPQRGKRRLEQVKGE